VLAAAHQAMNSEAWAQSVGLAEQLSSGTQSDAPAGAGVGASGSGVGMGTGAVDADVVQNGNGQDVTADAQCATSAS